MANSNFIVQNGLQVGPYTVFAGNGDIITAGNISTSGAGSINSANGFGGLNPASIYSGSSNVSVTANNVFANISGTPQLTVSAAGVVVAGNLTVNGTTETVNTIIINNTEYVASLNANGTTNSTSTTTGTIITAGGVGIAKDVYVGGNVNVTGNVNSSTGNINIVNFTGSSGSFYGNAAGYGALYAGVSSGYVALPFTPLQITTNFNAYSQLNQQNINSGAQASSDYVVTANNGNDSTFYGDFGIASNTYSYPGLGLTAVGPNDTYLLGVGYNSLGSYTGNVGNVVISSSNGMIKLASGGANIANVVATITPSGLNINSGGITTTQTTFNLLNATATTINFGNAATSVYVGASSGASVLPTANSVTNLGSTSAYWNNLYSTAAYHNTVTIGGGPVQPAANLGASLGGTSNYWNNAYVNALTATGITVNTGKLLPGANVIVDIGSTTAWFNNIYGTATHALYADLAENYLADRTYHAGTVLMFGGDAEVTMADADTKRVAGVVSTNPAHLMNGALQGANVTPLALMGRVPCQVVGPIAKGDLLVAAGWGYAKANNDAVAGQIIGKSLEDFPQQVKGLIEVVVGRV